MVETSDRTSTVSAGGSNANQMLVLKCPRAELEYTSFFYPFAHIELMQYLNCDFGEKSHSPINLVYGKRTLSRLAMLGNEKAEILGLVLITQRGALKQHQRKLLR